MASQKAKYLTNTIYYTAIPILRNFLAFFTLPIMTRYLSPDNYGTVSLVTIITGFSWVFYMGINSATHRLFFKYKNDIANLRKLFSTALFFITVSSILYFVILLAIFPFLNNYFFKSKLHVIWIILGFLQVSFAYINLINQEIFQNRHDGRVWFFNELVAVIVMISLSVTLVVTKMFTFEALIIAGVTAEFIKCGLIFYHTRHYYALIFRPSFLKESLVYSWPQVPSSLMSFGYSYFDRILLSKINGLSDVGILDLSSKISSMLKMTMEGIGGVLTPVSMDLLTENTKASIKKLADIYLKFAFFVLFLALAIILFSKEMILLLTTKEYHFAIYVVPIYIYYHIFAVLGSITFWLIYLHPKKTFWQIPLNLVNLVANTLGNIVLIPKYGLIGAAFATFISSGVTNIIHCFIGFKITPIPLDKLKLTGMFLMVIFETALLYLIYYLNLSIPLGIAIKLFMLLLFILIGQIWGTFDFRKTGEYIAIFKKATKGIIFPSSI